MDEHINEASRCQKCGSAELIPNVEVIDAYGSGPYEKGRLQLEIQERPDAMIFKRSQQSMLTATFCAQCGFTELYVTNPGLLADAYRKREQR